MCQNCHSAERVQVSTRRNQRLTTIPSWVNPEARDYIQAQRFPMDAATVRFQRQLVFTRVSRRASGYHSGTGLAMLRDLYVLELFPEQRAFYDPYFSFQRSGQGFAGDVRDAFTRDDEMWEALYASYQLFNHDITLLVYERHMAPSDARGLLYQIDARCYNLIMGAMIRLSTSFAGSNAVDLPYHVGNMVATVVSQVSEDLGFQFRVNTSLGDAIINAVEATQPNGCYPY